MFPICKDICLEDIPSANRFGAQRKHDIHTGLDLFCPEGEFVFAWEDGIVTDVCAFTGPSVDMPWWNDTAAVAVEGESGVILYGEIYSWRIPGEKVYEGDIIGTVLTVLKKDKGLPMSMLHIEWYEHGYRGNWDPWIERDKMPKDLKNIEKLLYQNYAGSK